MQNNKETNENVSRVVAEFFKKKPRDAAPAHKPHSHKPQYNNRFPKKSTDEDRSAEITESVKSDAGSEIKDQGTKEANGNHGRRGFRNKNRFGRHGHNNDRKTAEATNKEAVSQESTNEVLEKETPTETVAPIPETAETKDTKSEASSSQNEWYDPELPVEIIGVRFQTGVKIYYFAPNGINAEKGENVIVETARGLEYATVQIPNSTVKTRDIVLPLKKVLRKATEADVKHHEENKIKIAEAMKICNEKIAFHKLEMKLVDVEYTFDNSKLLFYFTSDGRVDFRELVKDLASVFKTRIELRQIGIREETKLLGGIGTCGLPYCCKTFLTDFVQVSIKMAKEQGLSLNSAKISGACGRLMCCLRYEYDTYDEEIRKTPKVDTPVMTPDGPGTVCETQPLAGLCKVRLGAGEDAVIKVFHRDDLKRIEKGGEKSSAQ